MIKYSKSVLISILYILVLFLPLLVVAQSYNFEDSSGLNQAATSAGFTESLKDLQPETLASKIISQVLTWLGVLFLGLTIYSGITWMTAEGNDQKVDKAKTILVASISGLIVVIAAYAISYFVINFFTR